MNAVEKNGQPSMEEILASIRRIIAEEPNGSSPVIDLRPKPKPAIITSLIDEQPDFELPAIFRPQPAPEKPAPLFGRLTDAIRNASGAGSDQKNGRANETAVPAEHTMQSSSYVNGHANGHGYLNGHANGQDNSSNAQTWRGPEGHNPMPSPALSQLNLARDEAMIAQAYDQAQRDAAHASANGMPQSADAGTHQEGSSIANAVSGWWHGSVQPAASEAAGDVKREMVPFKDMKMSRMGNMSSPAPFVVTEIPSQPHADLAVKPAMTSDYGVSGPVHMDVPEVLQMPAKPDYEPAYTTNHVQPQPYLAPEPPLAPVAPPTLQSQFEAVMRSVPELPLQGPGPYAQHAPPHHAQQAFAPPGGVEDATADLLRPMLRQWLAENMPRMVEKALHIEVAESVRVGKKPGSV